MPYIKHSRREFLDSTTLPPDTPGELNYSITRIIDDYLDVLGVRYSTLNECIGVLECAKLELYRRIASPYEDIKIQENGDVYTLEIRS